MMAMPKARHTPERSCIACGQKLPKRDLIRVVRSPEGNVAVDPTGKSPGRGAYLFTAEQCWQSGVQRGGLERGLRASLSLQEKTLLSEFYQQKVTTNVTVES